MLYASYCWLHSPLELIITSFQKGTLFSSTLRCKMLNLFLFSLAFYQQSSTDIWHAVCAAVKSACSLANVDNDEVSGLGFAATCSLGLCPSVGHYWQKRKIVLFLFVCLRYCDIENPSPPLFSCCGFWWLSSHSILEWGFKKKCHSLDGS